MERPSGRDVGGGAARPAGAGSTRSGNAVLEALEGRRYFAALQEVRVADIDSAPVVPLLVDQNLKNPWGMVVTRVNTEVVADNATGIATSYGVGSDGPDLATSPGVITIPTPNGSGQSLPTGVGANYNASDFLISQNGKTGSSHFIFDTLRGTIAAFCYQVNPTTAITEVDNSGNGASYTGLTVAGQGSTRRIYAANFGAGGNAGSVDVYDASFQKATLPGNFTDPNLPAGFDPFNVAKIDGQIYVSFVEKNASTGAAVQGNGTGVIDVFGTGGVFKERLTSDTNLNDPWGMTASPTQWGDYANKILVGNFGEGDIEVFGRKGKMLGFLMTYQNTVAADAGIWSLTTGVAGNNATANDQALFITAGINNEQDGIFGTISD